MNKKKIVKVFTAEQLHAIILFDDISNSKLFSSNESYFSQQLRCCWHTNISYFLLIQGWICIKQHIKNEITTLMTFQCFNNQQLHYTYSQSASNLTYEEFTYVVQFASYRYLSRVFICSKKSNNFMFVISSCTFISSFSGLTFILFNIFVFMIFVII